MELAVGGEFEAIGILERQLLIQHGLRTDAYVVDVGCGSGRLARPLAEYLQGPYLGTDVVPGLVEHARSLVQRPDWRFEVVDAVAIPERDACADVVCFFSVFTHLLYEDTFRYLREAKRVLKPGGKIVLSFLDFRITSHWAIFEMNVRAARTDRPLDMFLGRDALEAWANHLDLTIDAIHDGDQPYITLPAPVAFESGVVHTESSSLGQSVCVMVNGR
jgi:SAM-dependent methyltransferase